MLLRGQSYSNNSLITFEDIAEGDSALLCLSTQMECCSADEVPGGYVKGNWYYPNGRNIPNIPDNSLYRNRGPSVVRLNRNVASTGVQYGIFKCSMPDGAEDLNFFIGIYPKRVGELYYCN